MDPNGVTVQDFPAALEESNTRPPTDQEIIAAYPEPETEITQYSRLEEIIDQDLALINYALSRFKDGWSQAFSVDSICKMGLMTMRAIEIRRKILNHPFGVTSKEDKSKGIGFNGFEDT